MRLGWKIVYPNLAYEERRKEGEIQLSEQTMEEEEEEQKLDLQMKREEDERSFWASWGEREEFFEGGWREAEERDTVSTQRKAN